MAAQKNPRNPTVRVLTVDRMIRVDEPFPPDPVPFLRLRGLWLRDVGLRTGTRALVVVRGKRITITPIE